MPGGAEQNDPAPWVGHTAVEVGSPASRFSERNWARVRSSVNSSPSRSVRAAEPTIREPPVNTPLGRSPSLITRLMCS